MHDPSTAGFLLLAIIGVGCAAGAALTAVLLRRLHRAAQADPSGRSRAS